MGGWCAGLASPTLPHNLRYIPGGAVAVGSGPGDPNTGTGIGILNANSTFNGPNVNIVQSSIYNGTGVVAPVNYNNLFWLNIGPGDELGGPPGAFPSPPGRGYHLYIITMFGHDTAENNDNYYQQISQHYHDVELFYVIPRMMPSRKYSALDAADTPTKKGIYDTNLPSTFDPVGFPMRPAIQSFKVFEIHADKYIDGQQTGYHGHNAIGLLSQYNQIGVAAQFNTRPSAARQPWGVPDPGDVNSLTQETDWQAPHFKPKFVAGATLPNGTIPAAAGTNDIPYWTVPMGCGNVQNSDNVASWALAPVIPDQWEIFVYGLLKRDYYAAAGEPMGRLRIWKYKWDEWATADPANDTPLLEYFGSTNQYVPTGIFNPLNPTDLSAMRHRPSYIMPAEMYMGSSNPSKAISLIMPGADQVTDITQARDLVRAASSGITVFPRHTVNITGQRGVGSVLSADYSILPNIYQWWRADNENGLNAQMIPGATQQNYTEQSADAHKFLRVAYRSV